MCREAVTVLHDSVVCTQQEVQITGLCLVVQYLLSSAVLKVNGSAVRTCIMLCGMEGCKQSRKASVLWYASVAKVRLCQ